MAFWPKQNQKKNGFLMNDKTFGQKMLIEEPVCEEKVVVLLIFS